MPVTPFGEYKPDISDYEGSTEQGILNVVPRADGYGPFPSLASLSASLGAQCLGAFEANKSDGSVLVFAATSTDLYVMNNTTFAWSKVSISGGYSAVSVGEQWQFVQFNSLVIAVQGNAVPQVFNVTSSTLFANLAGSPPQARYVTVVSGVFVVLSGLLSNPNRVQWSGLNDVNGSTSWTPGLNSSDFQDLADGGFCRGVAGSQAGGIIVQDTVVRGMIYQPGSPIIFQIEKIADGLGIYGPYSLIRSGSTVFFFSLKGFQRIDPGGVPVPIGRERVDRTFFTDLDVSSLGLFHGIADPRSSRVLWVYKSVNGIAGRFDKALLYDPVLDKFTPLRFSGELLFQMAQPGVTLEGLDALFGSNLDSMTQSLDSFPAASVPELAAFDSSHVLNFFRGPNLEATLQTAEQGTDGTRIKEKKGLRPITDSPVVMASASARENLQQTAAFGSESGLNPVGLCNFILDSRYSRFKCRIPAGTVWTFINGVEPASLKASGKR